MESFSSSQHVIPQEIPTFWNLLLKQSDDKKHFRTSSFLLAGYRMTCETLGPGLRKFPVGQFHNSTASIKFRDQLL